MIYKVKIGSIVLIIKAINAETAVKKAKEVLGNKIAFIVDARPL